jgi:DNA-binding transcriptional ArsR family regulator
MPTAPVPGTLPTRGLQTVDDAATLQALAHPLRIRILETLHEPDSAAAVARRLGEPRQKVNYHLKELDRAGLVRRAGERRNGNFVETLYESVARTLLISPRLAWSDPRRIEALRAQLSLERLVSLGEHVQRDAALLLDRAAFDGEEIASASVEADVHFATEDDRAAFLDAYLESLRELCDRFGSKTGEPFRVVMAAFPAAGEGEDQP